MSDSPDPVLVETNLAYTLTVANQGPSEATGVTLTDILPAGVSFISATPGQGTCSGTSTLTCDIGTLANGDQAVVTIVVTPNSTGNITNTASVTGDALDPNSADNSASETTTVTRAADLSLTLSDSPDPTLVESDLTYTLTVTNSGPSDATDVTLTDTLPDGVRLDSSTPSQGTCSGTSTVTCALGAIAVGDSATVTNVVTPNDYQATLMHLFGLDHKQLAYFFNGQEQIITNNRPARVVRDVLERPVKAAADA